MAISGISPTSTASIQNNQNDPRQQFQALSKAISSGNLAGAQQAFAQLSQTLGGNSTNGSGASNPNDPLSQALSAIGQALQSGNIGGAQQALASLQQQAQSSRGHHHHGGHHHGGGSSDAGASSPATSPLTSGTSGSNVDVTA